MPRRIGRARVNLQVDTADIPAQGLITKDNVTVRVEAGATVGPADPLRIGSFYRPPVGKYADGGWPAPG